MRVCTLALYPYGVPTRVYIYLYTYFYRLHIYPVRSDLDIFTQIRVLRVDPRQFILPDCEMLFSPCDEV